MTPEKENLVTIERRVRDVSLTMSGTFTSAEFRDVLAEVLPYLDVNMPALIRALLADQVIEIVERGTCPETDKWRVAEWAKK